MAMRLKVNKVLGPFVFTKGRDITITPDFSMKFIINLLWGDAFDEKIIVTLIETIGNEFLSNEFQWLGNEFWIKKEVNLWELKDSVSEEGGGELKGFIHPMQPDIDILFGPKVNNERLTPLTAVEVKLFKGIERGRVTPRAGGEFPEGLGEAIALLTFGVDFVELWQFFLIPLIKEIPSHLPSEVEKKLLEELEKNKGKRDKYLNYVGTYAGFVGNLIKELKLPLGYRCFAISMEEDGKIWLHEDVGSNVLPKKNPFLVKRSEAALKIRSLIKEALNVKEGNNGR